MEKPSTQEEEFFAREEIEKKRKLALAARDQLAQAQRDSLKALHQMKCPKCGMDLHTLERGSVEVDACFSCDGLWLDAGELERLMSQRSEHFSRTLMFAVLNLFGRKPKAG